MIRRATAADTMHLVGMGLKFIGESRYRTLMRENPECIDKFIQMMLANEKARIFVAEVGGELVGMIAFWVLPHYFSGEPVAHEVVWWVRPANRGGRAGIALLRAAEKEAREMGAVHIQMISPSAQTSSLYQRMGFSEVETTYQRRLQ